MVKDGVALVKFYMWAGKRRYPLAKVNEVTIADKLYEFGHNKRFS